MQAENQERKSFIRSFCFLESQIQQEFQIVGLWDILFTASKQAAQLGDKRLDTTWQQTMHFENMLRTFSGSTHKKDTRHALLPLITKSSLCGRIFSLLKFTIGWRGTYFTSSDKDRKSFSKVPDISWMDKIFD